MRPSLVPVHPQYVVDAQVTLEKKELLDAIFDESGTVGAIEAVGDLAPYKKPMIVRAYVCVCVYLFYVPMCI